MTDLHPGVPRQVSQATLGQLQAANHYRGRRLLLHRATVPSMDDEAGDLAAAGHRLDVVR